MDNKEPSYYKQIKKVYDLLRNKLPHFNMKWFKFFLLVYFDVWNVVYIIGEGNHKLTPNGIAVTRKKRKELQIIYWDFSLQYIDYITEMLNVHFNKATAFGVASVSVFLKRGATKSVKAFESMGFHITTDYKYHSGLRDKDKYEKCLL